MKKNASGVVGTYGLPLLAVVLIAVFSIALPQTFPTSANVSAILSNNAIPALLALGAMIPIAIGKFDLSIGYGLGLAHVLALKLVIAGWPWLVASITVVLALALVGVINGLLVEFGQIDSFVATLGSGTVLYAITGAITGGARVVPGGSLPTGFVYLYDTAIGPVPIVAVYVAVVAAVLWVVLERFPVGRYFYVIGSSARAAALVGISTRKYAICAFALSASVTGFAGVLLASQQQVGNPSVGMDYLLPAFVGALLGSTAIRPGRVNAIGTVVAVITLAVGLAGINQMGADFWVTDLFNGVTLLIALGLAGFSARRKVAAGLGASRQAMREGAGSDAGPGGSSASPSAGAPSPSQGPVDQDNADGAIVPDRR
ncbi:ABC transporter permease [Calidifontibacter sp. DB0510]|uniref:ABC transporter permease n=1 Tax=Metallococcus carri TaxID=1656884 RepID=A0A967AWI1_9MICO|nr:ABC transporter permease [Metallococcus carri]NHN54239.1 ABC transporter permease [Metallococcus carri]NOP36921.1 ABC transporter permease [Calidifontibacter sp. DB2511S]